MSLPTFSRISRGSSSSVPPAPGDPVGTAVTGSPPPSPRTKLLVLAAGGVALVAGVAVAAVGLGSGDAGTTDTSAQPGVSSTPSGTRASSSPTIDRTTAGSAVAPTQASGGARNPFAAGGASTAGTTTAAATSAPSVTATPTPSATPSASATVTKTVTAGASATVTLAPVYLGLYSLSSNRASYRLNDAAYTVTVGHSFATSFRFVGLQTVSGQTCAATTYGTTSLVLCPGDVLKVK